MVFQCMYGMRVFLLVLVGLNLKSTSCQSQGISIAGYLTVVDVSEHTKIDLDVKDMEEQLNLLKFTEASIPYIYGGNSLLPTRFPRTLQDLSVNMLNRATRLNSEDGSLIPEFFLFSTYYNDPQYADNFIISNLIDATLDDTARATLVLRGVQLQLAWMNALFEFYNALDGCYKGEVRAIAWDEGVAFYTGSLVDSAENAIEGKLQCSVAQQEADHFPNSISANDMAFMAFEHGKIFVDELNCDELERTIAVVKRQMTIPLLQGLLYYSKLADPSTTISPTEKNKAEAWSFAVSLLPFFNQTNPDIALEVEKTLKYTSLSATYNYTLVYTAVKSVLSEFCITCEDIGVEDTTCDLQEVVLDCPQLFDGFPESGLGETENFFGYFSFPAFFIVFREALEASIVCAVLLGIIDKTEQPDLKRYVWIGVALGTLITLVALAALVLILSLLTEGAGDRQRRLLQGSLSICAAVLIGYLALTIGDLLSKHKNIEERVLEEAEESVEGITWKTMLFLSFTAVSREGIETVVFLGVGSYFEGQSLPLPIFLGSLVGILCGYLLYKVGSKFALKAFFQFTIVLLVFIGAGIFTHAIEEFQVVFDYGEWWEYVVFNVSRHASLRFPFWGTMRALFGWTPYPSRAEVAAYLCYHILLWTLLILKYILFRVDAKAKQILANKQKQEQAEEAVDD